MTDISELERTISYNRTKIVENLSEQPSTAAVAAFDTITELLIAVISELRELRRA